LTSYEVILHGALYVVGAAGVTRPARGQHAV
jgi:hypothetical protein